MYINSVSKLTYWPIASDANLNPSAVFLHVSMRSGLRAIRLWSGWIGGCW